MRPPLLTSTTFLVLLVLTACNASANGEDIDAGPMENPSTDGGKDGSMGPGTIEQSPTLELSGAKKAYRLNDLVVDGKCYEGEFEKDSLFNIWGVPGNSLNPPPFWQAPSTARQVMNAIITSLRDSMAKSVGTVAPPLLNETRFFMPIGFEGDDDEWMGTENFLVEEGKYDGRNWERVTTPGGIPVGGSSQYFYVVLAPKNCD